MLTNISFHQYADSCVLKERNKVKNKESYVVNIEIEIHDLSLLEHYYMGRLI